MDQSFEGQGDTPVRALAWNIVQWFENLSPGVGEALKKLAGSVVARNFEYGVGAPLMTPWIEQIGTDLPVVRLPEGFCAFQWMLSYALLGVREAMGAQGLEQPGASADAAAIAGERAFDLLRYAFDKVEAAKCYPAWSGSGLPQPEGPIAVSDPYVEKANAVYVSAMSFVLCHEVGHAKLKHIGSDPATEHASREGEAAADHFAMDCFRTAMQEREEVSFTLQVGLIASIALVGGTSRSATHPSPLDRIEDALSGLDLPETASLWGFAAVSLLLIDFLKAKTVRGINPEHPKGAYQEILARMKQGYLTSEPWHMPHGEQSIPRS